MIAPKKGRVAAKVAAQVLIVGAALALSACSSGDPLSNGAASTSADETTVTVGSAAFSENVILANIYGQALEANGFTVEYKLNIGAREAYVPALQAGEIDLIPDYSGNLLTHFERDATANTASDVLTALQAALPTGLEVLDPSMAEDKDSFVVTAEYAAKNQLKSIADLKNVGTFALGSSPEFLTRPQGLAGFEKVYGITDIKFTAISDNGGPATLKALLDNTIQVADIYTTTPSILANKLVTLEDPKDLIAAQQVIPLVSASKNSSKLTEVLNTVSATLTTQDLLELNTRVSGDSKTDPAEAAKDWLATAKLL
ncbi:ABC transporter substrate-binding protein [Cryobacterium sp. CG_9.6]|uniref:ABC transporter substrate-binding protein n=1 Tax=Cryobacterium sp. CG_9.6 TaxID=2760710 RepID=UPI002474DE98|nr:ABC transporter substrate-binding protein [Cryobacterium sp. CG_9.6]MDH6238445.1 osmoprotectant transport system substrate-binding protein [Cryobacterium sp. CG_9.6]